MTHEHEFHETPSGTIDGSNKTFSCSYTFVTESLEVYLNGLLQIRDTDYAENGNLNGFVMTNAPLSTPVPADTLWVHYIKSS